MVTKKAAFSLVESIIVVLIVGVLAVIAIPRFNYAVISKYKAESTAAKVVTDLRRTRSLAISNAATNTAGFALNMTGSSPYSGYEIVNLDTSEVVDSHSIDSAVTCTGGSAFQFGPLGSLKAGSDTQLTIAAEGRSSTITITGATGAIKCVEN
jgi:prepilin-type N-terminal cleavage/methylation domain-containing protein